MVCLLVEIMQKLCQMCSICLIVAICEYIWDNIPKLEFQVLTRIL